MIISASYKTDIPAFYGAWFAQRLAAGGVWVRNPWNGKRFHVDLRAENVNGFVFWTKNLGPFLAPLELAAERAPFVVQMTITGYPRQLEAAVIAAARAIGDAATVQNTYGAGRVVWRYDPVVISTITPADWHRKTFAGLAVRLAGLVDEVVVSFAQPYRKTQRNLDKALAPHGATWRDPPADEKCDLLAALAAIAADHHIRLTVCSQPELENAGIGAAICIDLARLSAAAGRPIAGRTKGNRPGCGCAESRDIGGYDTCPHGCAYCYAVTSQAAAKARFRDHDPGAEQL